MQWNSLVGSFLFTGLAYAVSVIAFPVICSFFWSHFNIQVKVLFDVFDSVCRFKHKSDLFFSYLVRDETFIALSLVYAPLYGEGGARGISVTSDWTFLRFVICEKAENKSVTCDRGIVCDLWWPDKKKKCDLWISKIICLLPVILAFSVPFSVIVIETFGKSVICD